MDARRTIRCSRGTAVASIPMSAPEGLSLALSPFGLSELCSVAGYSENAGLHSSKCVFYPSCTSGSGHRWYKVEECDAQMSVCLSVNWVGPGRRQDEFPSLRPFRLAAKTSDLWVQEQQCSGKRRMEETIRITEGESPERWKHSVEKRIRTDWRRQTNASDGRIVFLIISWPSRPKPHQLGCWFCAISPRM